MVKIGSSPGTFKFMLGKISDFNTADIMLYRRHLACHIIMTAVAFKGWGLMRIIGTIGKPQGVFQPKPLPHQRAFFHQPVIKGSGFLHPSFWQGFIGKGHYKAAFIIFR